MKDDQIFCTLSRFEVLTNIFNNKLFYEEFVYL